MMYRKTVCFFISPQQLKFVKSQEYDCEVLTFACQSFNVQSFANDRKPIAIKYDLF